jgi:hypothetical protein
MMGNPKSHGGVKWKRFDEEERDHQLIGELGGRVER